MSAEPEIVEQEVEVQMIVSTTRDDARAALERSGIAAGNLIGEALIMDVQVSAQEE